MVQQEQRYSARVGETKLEADLAEYGLVRFSGEHASVQLKQGESLWKWRYELELEGHPQEHPVAVQPGDEEHEYVVFINGEVVRVSLETARDERLKSLLNTTAAGRSTIQMIRAPMPGLLKSILVEVGSEITKGDSLCILEAMKMENEIKSPGSFNVGEISVEPGTPVEKGTVLMQLLPLTDG